MRKICCVLMTVILVLGLASCTGEEERLCTGYCEYYNDGGLCLYHEYTYEYDRKGLLVKVCDYRNGRLDTTREMTYVGSGAYTESEYDSEGDLKAVREYDDKGGLRKESEYGNDGELKIYREYNGDGLIVVKESFEWSHYIIRYEYDEYGSLVKETDTETSGGGSETVYESLYNSEGERISRTVTTSDGSSFVDFHSEIEEEGNKRIVYEYGRYDDLRFIYEKEYDEYGHLLKEVTRDMSKDEILSSCEYEYDSEGRLIRSERETMNDRYGTRYTYYSDGAVSTESHVTYRWISSEAYGDGSDAVLSECITVNNYDTDGKLTRIDYLVDGRRQSYTMYYYENVTVKAGSEFDFREDGRELDQRVYIVY